MKNWIITVICCVLGLTKLGAEDCEPMYACSCTECFGFESELSFDIGAGYRQDNIQWNAFPNTIPAVKVEEKWKDLQMGIVETNGQFLVCEHFLVKADFDFGWFNNNNGIQTVKAIDLSSFSTIEDLSSRTHGRMYDVSGAIGYQFNWNCCRYAFTPLVGYSYHYQKLKNKEYHDHLDLDEEDSYDNNKYIYRWRGPTLGCTVAMQVTSYWQFYFTYNYHWLRFRGHIVESFAADVDLKDREQTKMKSNQASGNEFMLGTIYQFSQNWFLGIKVDYKTFCGNKGSFFIADEHLSKEESRYPLRKLKWDSLCATLDVGIVY